MTIYICDDSKSDLLRLNHHLQEYLSHQDQKITIESFQSGEELLRRYEETMEKPSLIFLDIYMDDPDGMSVAHTLREEHYEGGLIFTTSSMEHAMDSYNVDALYYLQKPYDHEDFMNAIRRCTSIFEGTSKQYRINVQGKELQIPRLRNCPVKRRRFHRNTFRLLRNPLRYPLPLQLPQLRCRCWSLQSRRHMR